MKCLPSEKKAFQEFQKREPKCKMRQRFIPNEKRPDMRVTRLEGKKEVACQMIFYSNGIALRSTYFTYPIDMITPNRRLRK